MQYSIPPDALRVRPAGLYAYPEAPAKGLPALRWTVGCNGLAHWGYVAGDCRVVIGSNLSPKGMFSIRWITRQEPQPWMFRRRLEDAIALAERVLELKGVIASRAR